MDVYDGTQLSMREEIRIERVKRYGSFLYCPERDAVCSYRDTEDGSCGREECLHDDPAWLRLQEVIAENRSRQIPEAEEPQANIRTQNRTDAEIIRRAIRRKEDEARSCYRRGWTKKGDRLTYEVIALEGKLRRLERKHD